MLPMMSFTPRQAVAGIARRSSPYVSTQRNPATFASPRWTTRNFSYSSRRPATSILESRLRDPSLFREKAYIDGQWVGSSTGETFDVTAPATNEKIGSCPEMGKADVDKAVAAATTAFESFRHTHPKERAKILLNWFNLMKEHSETLAQILMFENGRPISGARQEIAYASSFFDWFSGEAQRSYGYTATGSTPGNRVITIQQPVGVVGILTPWNFPSAMITRKVAGAIAAGCSVVIKPAAETPYSALALAELGERAGVPKGVFNIVTTEKNVQDVGSAITTHPDVRKISFTGSTRVGKLLMQQASSTMKKMSLELGGNAPTIIFNDADLSKVMTGLIAGKFRGSGQTCVSPNRLYVQSGIHDKFISEFVRQINEKVKAGPAEDDGTILGCLIGPKAVEKIEHLVKDAKSKGAKAVIGGERKADASPNFYPATILTDMKPGMEASQTELFGPVAAIYRFDDEADILRQANDSEVGLAGYIYTENLSVAWRVAEALQTGMVGLNTGLVSDPVAPFGGVKESGFGREGGRHGIEEFQVSKTITLAGLDLPHTTLNL